MLFRSLAGTDVMHSWMVSSLGVQTYVVPGRVNESWVRINKPGVYYGQCNQICGINHAYMPIAVEALPKAEFERWAAQAKQKFAAAPQDGAVRVAQAGEAAVAAK